jgi:hypothetical protein
MPQADDRPYKNTVAVLATMHGKERVIAPVAVLARQISRFATAACSFSTPMICSSMNRARFICASLCKPHSDAGRGKSLWQVTMHEALREVRVRTPTYTRAAPAVELVFSGSSKRFLSGASWGQ